ncbi:hypothetical protein AB205_0123470 [Aquarana catesbeiana]|uniref:Uncharacterized protein n=1 Tax=Aquarana catesbeiana TaxID=8400 RepID=A0A2G9P227_AQUCT|nr:hypothetical protein AB205_0123470 [Aquarana catesbeiana]
MSIPVGKNTNSFYYHFNHMPTSAQRYTLAQWCGWANGHTGTSPLNRGIVGSPDAYSVPAGLAGSMSGSLGSCRRTGRCL